MSQPATSLAFNWKQMRVRRSQLARLAGVLFVLVTAAACVARGPAQSAGSAGGHVGGFGGSGSLAGDPAGAAGQSGTAGQPGPAASYRVTVHAVQTVLCAGQCTELTAEAAFGNPPYAYAWDGELGDGEGPHRVCPAQTTTFAVTATDTAVRTEELGRPSQSTSGSITIQVIEGDACALDGGVPSEQPHGGELCSIAIPYQDDSGYPLLTTWGDAQSLATDVDGNLYLAGTYTAQIDLGDGFNALETTASVFIAKYSPSCELLWHRHFTVQPHAVRFNTVAVSPSGDQIVAAGWLLGTVQFDEHIATTGPGLEGFASMLLVGFDPSDDHALWTRTGDEDNEPSGLYNLSFDGAGDMIVDGWAGPHATMDGMPLDNARAGGLIAKLSSTGDFELGQVFEGSETYLFSAVAPSGAIAVTSLGRENTVTYGGEVVLEVPGAWHRFLSVLGGDGALLGSRDLDADMTETITSIGVHAVRFDRAGDLLIEHGDYVIPSSGAAIPERISKLTLQGELVWTRDVSPAGYVTAPFAHGTFMLDTLDNIIHTDLIENDTVEITDAGVRERDKTPCDVIVQKLDPSGELLWRRVFDTDTYERAWGLEIGPDDSIWVGHGEDNDADPWSGTLRITKLAP